MYAGKQAFLAVGILIISILILYVVKYSSLRKTTEGFAPAPSPIPTCTSPTVLNSNSSSVVYSGSDTTRDMCRSTGWWETDYPPPQYQPCIASSGEYVCNRKNNAVVQCVAGSTYSSTGNQPCNPCPANATCTKTGFTCNTGFVQSGTNCQQVTCPAGQYLNGSTCRACPPSTYQPQGNFTGNSCKAIPPTNVASSTASSVTCATGYSLSADGTQCLPNPCTPGINYNNVTGTSPCRDCPANSSCTATGYTCQTGYIASGLACEPGPCAQGTYSTSGKIPCTPCSSGYTTTGTGATSSSSCQTTIQVTDILNKLNYSATNIPGQFYGLTAANINVTGPQTFTQGQTINYLSYLTPASLVTAAAINYINGTTYNLTNPQGKPVNNQGSIPMIISTLPSGTQGSIQNMNTNSLVCTGVTPASCTFVYNVPGGGTQSTNPCPSMNSFYDFDKGFCVDNNGNRVTSTRSCDSSSLFNSQVNACIPVKSPYFKTVPPNTTGNPGPGDYTNCLTIDGADCQPVYTLGATKSVTNPCSESTPIYDFTTHSCKPSVTQSQGSSCCAMGINAASTSAACLPYITTTTTKNATLCASKPSLCCTNPAYSTNATCKNQKYWTVNKSYKSDACSVTGFIDVGDDMTMQQKVVQWAEKRKMLNAP